MRRAKTLVWLLVHVRDPKSTMQPDEDQGFEAVFESIVGSLPTGAREEQ